MGMDAVLLNAEPDGTFPNHDPNPLKDESKEQASREVLEQGAAFGVMLDGDGDRILFVDEKGTGNRELLPLLPRGGRASCPRSRRCHRV